MQKEKCTILRLLCTAMIMILFGVVFLPSAALGAEENAENLPLILSEEELEFVRTHDEIVIGCPVGSCPLIFEDEKTGELKGITIDILNMISEESGLKFRYQPLPTKSISYADLQQFHVDMVSNVEYHDINKQAHGIEMTLPYLQAQKVFVCKKGVLFQPESEMVIAIASGSPTLERVIKEKYPNFQVEYYETTDEALRAVLSGHADAVLQNQYLMERTLGKPLYENLQIVATASIGDSQCLACLVPISDDGQNILSADTLCLLSIINKSIASLDERRVSFYIIKETAENTYKFTFGDLLYRYRYILIVLFFSLLLIVFLLRRNRILQKEHLEQAAAEKRAKELSIINEHMHEQQILLKDALERAEEGCRIKSSFLFNMSHDMRTPMNAILGFAAIAARNQDNKEKLADSLEKIRVSGNHLLQLINETLDMTEIESDQLTLKENVCNLVEIVQKAPEALQEEIDKKEITIQTDISSVNNQWVYCDSMRMDQILFNLLSNAVKFSHAKGTVIITLRQHSFDMENYAAYELRVKDYGIGMSAEFQSHIFEMFERERTSTASKIQGSGLGMSITKKLVDLMGGAIEVQSELQKGTEFILHFAFKIHEEEQQAEEAAPKEEILHIDFSGKRLLLVEDNELNREIIQEILGTEGFVIETAEDGHIAVEMVRNSTPGHYDAILMDIQMPVMDGYQATREIRSLNMEGVLELPIIAVTANAYEEDKKKALANGMNAHIAKPIDIDILHKTLEKFLKGK